MMTRLPHVPATSGRATTRTDCYVGAKQVALAGEVDRVFVILAVTVTCESQANCDSLAADPQNGVGSSVVFEPDDAEFGTPTESPSESSSESPTNG